MAQGKSQTARRRDVRRAVPRPTRNWWDVCRQREVGWAAFFLLLLTLIGGGVALSARERPAYHLGQLIDRPIVSRVQFEAQDAEATDRNRDYAQREVLPIFRPNLNFYNDARERVLSLLSLPDSDYEALPPEYLERIALDRAGFEVLRRYVSVPGEAGGTGGTGGAGGAEGEQESLSPEQWAQRTERMLRQLFNQAILRPEDHEVVMAGERTLRATHPSPFEGEEAERPFFEQFLLPMNNRDLVARRLQSDVAREFQPELRDTITKLLMEDLAATYTLDQAATEQARRLAEERAETVSVLYMPDEVVVPSGTVLTGAEMQLIQAEHDAADRATPVLRGWLAWAGLLGLVLIVGLGVWLYVFAYNPKIRRNPVRGFALTALLLLCQGLAVGIGGIWPEITLGGAGFATLFAAMILAIVYDQRFAVAIGLALTLLIVLSLRLPTTTGLVLMIGVVVAVAQLGEIRSRSKLVTAGLWAGLAMGGVTLLAGLSERRFDLASDWTVPLLQTPVSVSLQWGLLGSEIAYITIAGLAVGLLVQGILPTIENVFHVTTAMTLRELNDAGHPLLQRMAQEAAGTYQHSLRIADMTEAAADAVGADGLLCRVGAMYHDVGKINKPQYFIENQGGGRNKHDKLSPALSLLIIVGHVKDGIEMAREYNLPTPIRHFIESHHGTTLVEYFYHAAKKQKAAEDKPAPSEFEFRYPGPKPQTREAAIMLLCDGIEAAARAMDEPTAVRLEQLVHGIASKRLMDGQFDECNMTLRDLSRVEAAITKTLCAVYHTRVKYPDGKKPEPAPPPRAKAV